MAVSSVAIVSLISLLTMVKSKKWPYSWRSISDSLARRSRLPSYWKETNFPKNKLTNKAATKQRIWETYICYVLQWGCRYEDHVGREFSCSQYFEGLRLHIQYGHFTVSVYTSYGVQFGAIHGILMGACAEGDGYSTHMIEIRRYIHTIFQILIGTDIGHHFVVRHKVIAASVLLLRLSRSRCICRGDYRL